jgi:YD repeat-containing protein
VLVAFVFGILQWACSVPARAQAGVDCTSWFVCAGSSLWNASCDPPIPGGAFGCQALIFEFAQICQLLTDQCAPNNGPVENGGGSAGCDHCKAGQPISLVNGNTYIEQLDVKIPGIAGGLALSRTWNSMWPPTQSASQVGLFGPNWRSTYEERVFVGSDNYIKYARGDGNFWSFGYHTGNTWGVAAPAKVTATLTQSPTLWTITFQNGEQRLFSVTSGSLVSIIDRNGNTTQLSYDALNRLVTVTDPASRHLNFTYPNGTSRLVSAVTSDVGLSLAYSYDTQGRLTKVTKPDLTTVSFQYDSNSHISSVLDSDGKVLESHTYDSSGRGLTSSRAGGVEALTVSY